MLTKKKKKKKKMEKNKNVAENFFPKKLRFTKPIIRNEYYEPKLVI